MAFSIPDCMKPVMPAAEKPFLRNCLRMLQDVEAELGAGIDRRETGQEMLDMLAMQAGLKPVFLLGRGLDDPSWIAGVLAVARELGLRIVEGPYWDATPFGSELPAWYVQRTQTALVPYRGWYVCDDAAAEHAVQAIGAADGRLTIAEEAELLGYPICCVAAHYERALAFHRATFSILARHGDGDAGRMAALFDLAGRLPAQTRSEHADLEAAAAIVPAPYGSWNMCLACATDGDGPSARLARRYASLARTVDAGWAAGLAASAEPPPRWTP